MTTKVNTPNLNTTFLGTLVKINDTQTVNNKTFNSATLIAPALGTPISGDFSTGSFTWPLFYQDIKANAAFVAANSAGVYANAAFDAANTGATNALSAGAYANAAYVQANTATTNAASADQRAVTSGVFANGAFFAANTADQKAVSAGVYANAAYGVSNTGSTNALSAGSYANAAFATANTKFNSTGGTISGDVTVTGNLTVSGNVFSVEATNLSVEDNMIYLNANNTVTNPDLGFAGNYNDGVYHHAGMFRDASDGIWKFFYNYDPEPDASPYIDTTHASFRIANVTANLITDVATIRGYDPINHTNSAYTQANTANTNAATADQRAVTSGVYANAAFTSANASINFTALGTANSASSYANSAFAVANAAVSLTGTQTLTNKSLSDNTTYFIDEGDASKKMQFQLNSISTGTTRILSVSDYDGIIATLYGTETLTNKTLSSPIINTGTIRGPIEPITVNGTAATATLNYYVQSASVVYYNVNATNNFTWNVAAANDVTLNAWLSTGRAVTIALLITNGATPYYPTAFTIDGTSVTPKYVGGNALTSGNANAIDFYNMTIIKTASATYTVFVSQTKLA
jgi:hypothetical protein